MKSTNTEEEEEEVFVEINKSDIWFVILIGLCIFMMGHGCGSALNQVKMERIALSNGVLYSVTNTADGKPVYLWKTKKPIDIWKTNNNQTPNN